MAIARDANSPATGNASTTSISWNHTCTGSNLILVVYAYAENNATITGITYNSVPMTQAAMAGPTSSRRVYAFYLINPATGTHSVAVTASGTCALNGWSASYTGAKQTGQPDATNSASHSSSTSESISVTTVANNSWIVGVFADDNGGTHSATGSWSKLAQGAGGFTNAGGWNGLSVYDTNGNVTPAGATTVGASSTAAAADTFIVGVSIAPAVAVNSNFLAFM